MLIALPIPTAPAAQALTTPSRQSYTATTPGTSETSETGTTPPSAQSAARPDLRPNLTSKRVTEPDRMSAASLLGSAQAGTGYNSGPETQLGPDTLAGPPPTFDVSILERDRALASAPPDLPPPPPAEPAAKEPKSEPETAREDWPAEYEKNEQSEGEAKTDRPTGPDSGKGLDVGNPGSTPATPLAKYDERLAAGRPEVSDPNTTPTEPDS